MKPKYRRHYCIWGFWLYTPSEALLGRMARRISPFIDLYDARVCSIMATLRIEAKLNCDAMLQPALPRRYEAWCFGERDICLPGATHFRKWPNRLSSHTILWRDWCRLKLAICAASNIAYQYSEAVSMRLSLAAYLICLRCLYRPARNIVPASSPLIKPCWAQRKQAFNI